MNMNTELNSFRKCIFLGSSWMIKPRMILISFVNKHWETKDLPGVKAIFQFSSIVKVRKGNTILILTSSNNLYLIKSLNFEW